MPCTTIEGCGAAFAFPSQTLYVERSRGPDVQLARAAEEEIERLREENCLPFPDYEEQVRREMSDTLDYPPKGSASRGGHDRAKPPSSAGERQG